MKWTLVLTVMALLLTVVGTSRAHARTTFSLDPTFSTATPGERLTFHATLTNGGADEVSLVGASGNTFGPTADGLLWDDGEFLTNLPLFLAASGIYMGELFLDVQLHAASGDYLATYAVDGESSGGEPFQAGAAANVRVQGANVVPGPGSLGLLLAGLGGLLAGRHPWRRSGSQPAPVTDA